MTLPELVALRPDKPIKAVKLAVEAAANDSEGHFDDIERFVDRHHNGGMETPINRAELNARLETIEAKMDGRLLRMESIVERIGGDAEAIRTDVKNMKTTVITTAIAAVIAIVLGVAAFNAALTSNMLTAFQAGQQTNQQK